MTKVLILKTVRPDGRSYGGFRWPKRGKVSAPDWDPSPKCGGGLHGLLWGCGDATLLFASRWLVFSADSSAVVDLGGKVKVPDGSVVFCGDRASALAYLDAHGAASMPVVYAARTAGYRGTATAGYRGTATAGDWGTATAGHRGTATAGDRGTATAGDWGTATAGDWGTATAGYCGTATAGAGGVIQIKWWDGVRYRVTVGYVGEDGIEPHVAYRCDNTGQLVKAR